AITLEFLPKGPRVDGIRLRQDAAHGEIEATFELMRPKNFMIFQAPPIRTIPMAIQLALEDADQDRTVQKVTREIGTMADFTRPVSIRIPWSEPDQPPPRRARLRARLEPAAGGTFDEPFALEFESARLEPVE